MGICDLSEIHLSCSYVPGTQVAHWYEEVKMQPFSLSWLFPSLGWVIPSTWGIGALLLPQALLEYTFHGEHCQLKCSEGWTLGTGMSSGDRKAPARHVLESCLW